jgi:hypothetical protein
MWSATASTAPRVVLGGPSISIVSKGGAHFPGWRCVLHCLLMLVGTCMASWVTCVVLDQKDSYFFELGGRVLTVLGATLGAPQTAAVQSAHSIMLGTARIMCEWYMQSKADRLLQ